MGDDKLIVEKTFEEAFAMCGQEKETVASLAGQLCGKIFVMDFNADKAKKIITEALKIFSVDWRIYSLFTIYLPKYVDQQGGIRRIWSIHCSSQMLLKATLHIFLHVLLMDHRTLYCICLIFVDQECF